MNLALKTPDTGREVVIPYDPPKILIVDDEPRMCDSLKASLSGEGYEIHTCNSGKEAVEHLSKNRVDLILLDIVMPEIGGRRVMRYINSQDPDTLVILMTGHASVDSAIQALRGGAYDYLRKPFEPEELFRTVRRALDEQRLKSERKQAEERLKESARRVQVAYDQSVVFAKELTEEIKERKRAEEALRKARDELERRVEERTAKLVSATEQLKLELTERRRAQEALKETRDYLENLLNYANTPIIVWDPDFNITRFNHAFEHMTGYRAGEVIGQALHVLFPEASRYESLKKIESTLNGEYWESVEIQILCKNGDIRLALWNSANIYAQDGATVLATIAQGTDITERKRAEEQIRRLSHELLVAQESERQRISRDLHDVVGQDLSALKIGLDTLFDNQPEAPPEMGQRLSEFSKILKGAITTVRDLSRTLRFTGLDKRGLVSTVRLYCKEFSRSKSLKVDFFATEIDESRLDFDTKINLYRMIQEGLNNVKKHADANHVIIRLVGSFANITLHIEDDGKGFDLQDRLILAANQRHVGLRIIEERAALLQGKMKIETYPKQGTRIVVEVPYKNRKIGRKENRLNC